MKIGDATKTTGGRVAHRLEKVQGWFPYETATCGAVLWKATPAADALPRCKRCWKETKP